MKKFLFFLLILNQANGQQVSVRLIESKVNSSFRGLSVVDNTVAWVSGSNGWVGRSVDGGNNWDYHQVKNFEKVDFRSLYGFSASKAVIANAGSPASILITDDGGVNWTEVYRNENKDAFIDGVDFWNDNEGVMYGDPLESRIFMIRSKNSGHDWSEIDLAERPLVSAGEASFAASGTGIRCYDVSRIVLATGGLVSHLILSDDKGKHWRSIDVPIIQGKSTTGIFSVAFNDTQHGIIVGGDYLADSLKINHVFYSTDGGMHWQVPTQPTRGYRECVEYLTDQNVISAGPTGIDVSYNGGVSWQSLSDEKGFHVVRKARHGSLMLVAGSKGKIGLIK